MAVLPKTIYRLNAIPTKIQTQFFTDLEITSFELQVLISWIYAGTQNLAQCSQYGTSFVSKNGGSM